MQRILMLTAGFGEGHNSAARAVQESLLATGQAEVRVVDLYADAAPMAYHVLKSSYSLAIYRYPQLWKLIFYLLDRPGWMERTFWMARAIQKRLEEEIEGWMPHQIVSTYPLYAYLFRRIQTQHPEIQMPFTTVITDSVGINSAWYRCYSDAFIVADTESAQVLREKGVPEGLIQVFGFPVSRKFALLEPSTLKPQAPWKVLFMPCRRITLSVQQAQQLLDIPDVVLTILTGRLQRLYDAMCSAGFADHPRCHLVQWSNDMPHLLAEHHLFIGKAGGAIVQEAIAAQCPFLVSHRVPGQEEGNILLLERLKVGKFAGDEPQALKASVERIFEQGGQLWKEWKEHLSHIQGAQAADRIAEYLLGVRV